ncbi:hypothetical protein [Lentzea sp. NPDC060358]|uniref:hypothetical protein n=1 Tax=Lentzea sp. NPDC060358 TaxID=3347103 RepID=UPI00365B7FC7
MDVVVQWVRTEWVRPERGGPGLPGSVPAGFVLPHLRPAVHEARLHERDGFRPAWSAEKSEVDRLALVLREDDGVLSVQLQNTLFAPPQRRDRPSPARLERGQWVRWQLDHRWQRSRDGGWNYLLTTLNLAYGPVSDARLFLGTPTRFVDERAGLS